MTVDPHGFIAPYALDALDDVERARFEAHLEDCEDCMLELAGFVETAARLGEAEAKPVPVDLRDRLMAEVAVTPQVRLLRPTPKWRMRLARGTVAAAVVLGIAGGAGYMVEHERMQDAQQTNVAMSTVLSASDAQTATTQVPGGGSVRVVYSASEDAAVALTKDLPALDEGRVYQLWMIDADGVHPQDTVTGNSSSVMKGLGGAESVAVTIEPAGGSTKPTTAPIATVRV